MRIIPRPVMLASVSMALICGSLSKPQTACGSYEAVKHIPSLTTKIRVNPQSPFYDMGGIAAVHNSATNLGSSSYFCGAILISDRYLLSAAHCFVGPRGLRPVMVSLGREDLNKDPISGFNAYEIQTHYIHHSYESGKYGYHDIAILQTKRKVLYNDRIWPFCLPDKNEVLDNNILVKIGGWGKVNSTHSASILKTAYVKIIENNECESQWRHHEPDLYNITRTHTYPQGLTNQILCAGRLGVDACKGDSGGPLSFQKSNGQHTVFGIVSRGITCADIPMVPGFYTNIPSYVDWIYDKTSPPGDINTLQTTPASKLVECPSGFDKQSNECFKLHYPEAYTNDQGKILCENQGLMLAEPSNPLQLRDVLSDRYGDVVFGVQLGGHSDGSKFVLKNSGQTLTPDYPLWFPNEPQWGNTNVCLVMVLDKTYQPRTVNSTYGSDNCDSPWNILCQMKTS